mgnify:CR=1 FL=1
MNLRKKLFLSTTLALLTFTAAAANFGAVVDKTKLVEVADILAKPQSYLQQQVTVKGTVEAVCQKKGCWMQFATAADQPTFRLKVKDGDIVFPVSAKGKTAYHFLNAWQYFTIKAIQHIKKSTNRIKKQGEKQRCA